MRTTLARARCSTPRATTSRAAGPTSRSSRPATSTATTAPSCPHEHRSLAGVLVGRLHPQTWGTPEPPRAGFFAAKGVLGAALDAVRVRWDVEPATEPFLHPGRSARVLAGGEDVGWIGELHPLVARAWDLDHGAALFEVDLDRVLAPRRRGAALRRPDELPGAAAWTSRVTLDDDVPAATVLATVREAGGELLADVRVFDLYRGEQVGEGRKSLALALSFRAADRTLTDEDVAPLRDRIVAALRDGLGGELRA